VHPQLATQYRLAWGDVRAGLAKVAVADRVDATVRDGNATGTTKPAVANAAVQLQWSADGSTGWQTVATATTDTTGAFSVPGASTAGAYRVRVVPGHGLAPGLSKSTPCC
jgi:hypothetical protein